MATCVDCISNCGDRLNTDKCILYTGDDVPLLGITSGQQLYLWEAAVVEKLQEAITGTGITLPEITIDCPFLTTLLGGADKTLANLLQLLVDGQCALRALIPAVQVTAFATKCLSMGVGATKDQIIQALIDKVCELNSRVGVIEGDYVKASQLSTLIQQYLQNTSGSVVQRSAKMVENVPYPYLGDMSVFDTTGKGLIAKGFDKVYLMNGLNGTLDARGRSFIGANTGIAGASMDAVVNPALPQNAGVNISIKKPIGEFKHALTSAEGAPHTHSINDPGHAHNTQYHGLVGHVDHTRGTDDFFFDDPTAGNYNSGFVLPQKTGITIVPSGNGLPHNTIHPSIGCAYIIYIP